MSSQISPAEEKQRRGDASKNAPKQFQSATVFDTRWLVVKVALSSNASQSETRMTAKKKRWSARGDGEVGVVAIESALGNGKKGAFSSPESR